MNEESIRRYVATTFSGVHTLIGSKEAGTPEMAWGDTFFIYDPNRDLEPQKQMPFATIVTRDYGEFDNASKLDRPGIFRLNVGVGKDTFRALFVEGVEHDFTALDRLIPHPVYGAQNWVSVLNPSEATFERVKPLLQEAYDRARRRIPREG